MFRMPGADELLRGSLLHMSDNKMLAHWLTHNPVGRKLATRFVAGETLDSAIDVVRQLNGAGLKVTLDHLGEAVSNPEDAIRAADDYLTILDRLQAEARDHEAPREVGIRNRERRDRVPERGQQRSA